MKSIVITANTSWYIYNFRKNTILALINAGYKVTAISPLDDYSNKLVELGCRHIHIFIDQGGKNILLDIKTIISFYCIFKKIKPRIVLNFTPKNNIYSTISASLNGIKSINNISGLGIAFTKKNILFYLVKFLYIFSQSKADVIFFQNKEDRKLFDNYNIAPNVKKIQIAGSGVDLNRFQLSTKKDVKPIKFLLASRLLYEKGVTYYIDAAKVLKKKYNKNIEFNLIGFFNNSPSAVKKEYISKKVDQGIINYLGVSDNIENIIAGIDCMILPSFYGEGIPKSLMEAAAMGKPIITTDNVGCRDVVENNINGYLISPKSLKELIMSIEKFIGLSYEDRLEMGLASRRKADKEFNEKNIINVYLSIIERYFV